MLDSQFCLTSQTAPNLLYLLSTTKMALQMEISTTEKTPNRFFPPPLHFSSFHVPLQLIKHYDKP